MTGLAATMAQYRLSSSDRAVMATTYLPWAVRAGTKSKDLMCVYYEEHYQVSHCSMCPGPVKPIQRALMYDLMCVVLVEIIAGCDLRFEVSAICVGPDTCGDDVLFGLSQGLSILLCTSQDDLEDLRRSLSILPAPMRQPRNENKQIV